MKKYNKTSDIVQTQVPSFFLDDYPTFVKFLEAYYKFLETQKVNKNLENFRDIDTTLTEFVNELKDEFAHASPNYANIKTYLAYLKQHFVSRGSEESYELLFRLLFNKSIEIQHPSESILRVSDGKWEQDHSIFVKLSSGDVFESLNQYIYVQTSTKRIRIHILNISVIDEANSVYELFFDKQYYGIISVGNTITYKTIQAVILPTTNKINIIKGGKNFSIGQVFSIDAAIGTGAAIKVTKVGLNGSISELKIISFGLGYQSSFYYTISNSTIEGELFSYPLTSQIRNLAGGGTEIIYQNPAPGYKDPTLPFVESGFINKQDYFQYSSDLYSDGTYVGDVLTQFYSNNAKTITEDYALLFIQLGSVAKYPGAYLTTDSFVSGVSYIQDGNFYQDYSYVIKVDEKLDNYKNAVLQYLHPTGRKLFGEYSIQNDFLLSIETVVSVIKKQFPEIIYVIESLDIDFSKGLLDSVLMTVDKPYYSFVKSLTESFTTTDINSYVFYKALEDSFSLSDTTAITFGTTFSDSVISSDINTLLIGKSLADSFTTTETGFAQLNPYNADFGTENYFAEEYQADRNYFN
jgi:hypothetical protein